MAKQTVLKERGTNEVMYPQTFARLVRTDAGDNMEDALAKAKFALFDDMFRTAAGIYGDIDHSHIEDGVSKPYYLNKIWMTYEEALDVCTEGVTQYPSPHPMTSRVRTNLFIETPIYRGIVAVSLNNLCAYANGLETVRVSADDSFVMCSSMVNTFWECRNLRSVFGVIDVYNTTSLQQTFSSCVALEEIYLKRVRVSVKMSGLKSINLESLQYLVRNAVNTSAITITVHPDVYAKLTDENNAEWHRILADAALKNINFATT